MRRCLMLAVLMAATSTVQAVEPYSCRNGLFPAAAGQVSAATIKADKGARAYLRSDEEGCPAAERCATKAFLIGGDPVLVSAEAEGWSCVWYFGKKREFVGWLPGTSLAKSAQMGSAAADWIGTWRPIAGDNEIRIAGKTGELLEAQGSATWTGGLDIDSSPVVHEGEFAGVAKPAAGLLTIGTADSGECRVRMQLVGGSLVVADNGLCGGANVRFDDVYRRTSASPADIPAEAQAVVERLASCTHFSGEFNGDGSAHDQEVSATMAELRCDTIEQESSVIARKYAGNAALRKALAAAIEP